MRPTSLRLRLALAAVALVASLAPGSARAGGVTRSAAPVDSSRPASGKPVADLALGAPDEPVARVAPGGKGSDVAGLAPRDPVAAIAPGGKVAPGPLPGLADPNDPADWSDLEAQLDADERAERDGGLAGALESLTDPAGRGDLSAPRPDGAPDAVAIAPTSSAGATGQQAPTPSGRVTITASVGRGGVNRADDVRTIRDALAARGYPASVTGQASSQAPGDGGCDAGLVSAIERFQRERAGFSHPDGRVDLGERTLRALNGEAFSVAPIDAALGAPGPLLPTGDEGGSIAPTSTSLAPSATPGAPGAPGELTPADTAPGDRLRTPGRLGPRATNDQVAPAVTRPADLGRAASAMDHTAAYAELDRLGVSYQRLGATLGVSDPVRVTPPINGVDYRYIEHTTSRPMDIDVRLAVALAHLSQALREHGVVRVLHIGSHVTNRAGVPLLNDHARGLAIDLGAFVVRTPAGERTIDVDRSWLTGRSTTRRGDGVAGVVAPTAAESSGMNQDERWLRSVWALLRTEFDMVVTPAHNREHWDHLHAGLRSNPRELGRSNASFQAAGHAAPAAPTPAG